MLVKGQYASALYTPAIGVTNVTWSNSNVQFISWSNGANQVTFSAGVAGGRYMLISKQPGTGAAGTATWPASVLWSGATPPTLTATNNKTDIVGFVYDGTYYYGNTALNF